MINMKPLVIVAIKMHKAFKILNFSFYEIVYTKHTYLLVY